MAETRVPTTEDIRAGYAWDQNCQINPDVAAEFDAWLAEHDRQLAERAWNKGAQAAYDSMEQTPIGVRFSRLHNPYRKEA